MQSCLFGQFRECSYVTGSEPQHVWNAVRSEHFATDVACGMKDALTQSGRARPAQHSANAARHWMRRERGWNNTPTIFAPPRKKLDVRQSFKVEAQLLMERKLTVVALVWQFLTVVQMKFIHGSAKLLPRSFAPSRKPEQ